MGQRERRGASEALDGEEVSQLVTCVVGKWDTESKTFHAITLADLIACAESAINMGIPPNTVVSMQCIDSRFTVRSFSATIDDDGKPVVELVAGTTIGVKG